MEGFYTKDQSFSNGQIKYKDQSLVMNEEILNWKFQTTKFEGYKYSAYGLSDNYFESRPQIPRVKTPELELKIKESHKASSLIVEKNPSISISKQNFKQEVSPYVPKNTLTLPTSLQVAPSKFLSILDKKTESVLVTSTNLITAKPVIPIQIITRPIEVQTIKRQSFVSQLKELREKNKKFEDPLKLSAKIPSTSDNIKVSSLNNRTDMKKMMSVNNNLVMTPELTIRTHKPYTSNHSFRKNQDSLNNAEVEEASRKQAIKLRSPYESVWPKKILANYYNLKLAPDHTSQIKKYKLVKISKPKVVKNEFFDKHLMF